MKTAKLIDVRHVSRSTSKQRFSLDSFFGSILLKILFLLALAIFHAIITVKVFASTNTPGSFVQMAAQSNQSKLPSGLNDIKKETCSDTSKTNVLSEANKTTIKQTGIELKKDLSTSKNSIKSSTNTCSQPAKNSKSKTNTRFVIIKAAKTSKTVESVDLSKYLLPENGLHCSYSRLFVMMLANRSSKQLKTSSKKVMKEDADKASLITREPVVVQIHGYTSTDNMQ